MKRKLSLFCLTVCVLMSLIVSLTAAQSGGKDRPKAIEIGDTVESKLREIGDVAAYTFEPNADQWVQIDVEADDFDPTVTLLDEDGLSIGYDDDSGAGTYSQLLFSAEAETKYTIEVHSLGDGGSGDFVMRLKEVEMTAIPLDTPTPAEFKNETVKYFQFEGNKDDVVNIVVTDPENNGNDLVLRLQRDDGSEIVYNDDGGEGNLPALRRFILPYSGWYLVKLANLSETKIIATYELEIQQTEALMLSDEPQTIELGENVDMETLLYEAADNVTYRLTVNPDDDRVALYIDIQQEGVSVASFNVSGMSRLTFDFEVPDDGMISVIFSGYYGKDPSSDFEVSLSEAQ